MARSTSSPRRARLPGDAAVRLHRGVRTRLSATLDDPELISLVGALCVPWLLASRDRLRLDRAKRLRLAPDVDRRIKRLARSLRLMVSNSQCGQQAGQAASKTLRALRTRRVDMDGLLQLEAGYRSLRQDDRHRHGSPKVYAPEESVLLDGGAMLATRLVSERLLTRLGRQADNCLANPPYRKAYAAEMKLGQTAFWRIDPADQPDSPVWVIAISLEHETVQELEHVGDVTTMPRDRDALLEFLTNHARVGRSLETDLSGFALSPDLVAASRAGLVRAIGALFAGSVWRFEVGTPGVLVAMPTDGPAVLLHGVVLSWMLHGARTGAGTTLSVQILAHSDDEDGTEEAKDHDNDDGDEDDGEVMRRPAAGPRTMVELELRLALREACRATPTLRRACCEAFAAESPLFIQDWFGIVAATARSKSQ